MDASRFDALARSFADRGSRRRFVAGLAAGVVGLLGQRGARADHAPDHCAQAGAKSKPDKGKPCCPGLIAGPGGRCVVDSCFEVDCSYLDTDCMVGVCTGGTCSAVDAAEGQSCPEGICQSGACDCAPNGTFCTGFEMCCSGLCASSGGWPFQCAG